MEAFDLPGRPSPTLCFSSSCQASASCLETRPAPVQPPENGHWIPLFFPRSEACPGHLLSSSSSHLALPNLSLGTVPEKRWGRAAPGTQPGQPACPESPRHAPLPPRPGTACGLPTPMVPRCLPASGRTTTCSHPQSPGAQKTSLGR